jgi:hypothetical protein
MGIQAFTPMGNTITFTATASSPTTSVQAASTTLGGNQYRIINSGNVTVFMGYGQANASAVANAVLVTSTQSSIPLLSGTDEILTFTPNAYFAGITSSGNAVIYITPGDGV